MPKNYSGEDIKSRNFGVVDVKSRNEGSLDIKPKMGFIDSETTQTYLSTINVGESMGLLLSLTYPNTFSFNTPFHP